MGADGTLWAIDTGGVPYSYDQQSQSWEVYAAPFDALTYLSRWNGVSAAPSGSKFGTPLVVRGSQLFAPGNASSPVATALANTFAGLPTSFALGLDGAAEVAGKLYLFRHGRYIVVDTTQAGNPVIGIPIALTSISGWPTSPNWSASTFQALGSCLDDPTSSLVHLFNNGEVLVIDLVQGKVTGPPTSYATYSRGSFLQQMQAGFSALTFSSQNNNFPKYLYQGAVQWETTNGTTGDATPSYPSFTPFCTPRFQHAPSGRAGALWAPVVDSTTSLTGAPAFHDGSTWHVPQTYPHTFNSIDAGTDGSVFALADNNTIFLQLQSDGSWSNLGAAPPSAVQLSVGDAAHIWVRDSANQVHRYANGGFSGVVALNGATHIAANADGTVWHAAGNANAYRFISEGVVAATPISTVAGTVIKMASNAFAAAVALIVNDNKPQVYTYDSSYVWKTGPSYFSRFSYQQFPYTLAFAGHTLFTYACNPSHTLNDGLIVALDAQSGNPLWPQPFTIPTQFTGLGGTLVYDNALNLVYVSSEGTLYALDGASGSLIWSLDIGDSAGDYGRLQVVALNGSRLAVGLADGSVALLHTAAALTSAQQKQPVALLCASTALSDPQKDGPLVVMGAPTFDSNGTVYVQGQVQNNDTYQPVVQALNPSTGAALWTRTDLPSASGQNGNALPADIVYGAAIPTNGTTRVPALFVNAGTMIYALNPADGTTINTYALPIPPNSNNAITTALTYQSGRLYFGDYLGTLYVIDATTFKLINKTADAVQSKRGVLGRVVLISDTDAPADVVAVFTRGDQNVWLFDPDSGNLLQTGTDLTAPGSLAYDGIHGLLYAMGWDYSEVSGSDPNLIGQVFALRPDQALQDERDFIIESQLMQDYHNDDEATNTHGAPRYQTHVTIVDDNTVPMNNTSVKLWAEEDGTVVSVDGGAPVTIGPNTPTLFTTDASGSFTVISGGYASDSSDAADLFAVTLQVWAPFMDSSERIVITPDAEFYGRVSATTASGNTNASQADPNGIDLSSTPSYNGTPLFTTDKTNQSAATTMASAMTQVTGATGVGANGTTAQLRRTLGGRLLPKQTTATPPKYHTYTDLPGMSYTPISALVNRGLNPTQPLGMSFSANGFQTHTPSEAADLIDAMQGNTPSGELGSILSSLRKAWSNIKKDAAEVKSAAISIAKEVYVGITYVVNGVTNVIKTVAADVKDAMVTIGAFFKQLGKLIENVIEALSILLHFEEFIKTQKFIKSYYTTMTNRLKGDLDNGFAKLQSYLGGLSTTVKDDFTKLIGGLQGHSSTGVGGSSNSWGSYTAGTSAHSTMSVAPVDGSAPKKSVAVQGMWAAHKSRQNASATTTPATLSDAQGGILSALESLFSNSSLFSNLDTIKSQFTSGISLKSPQAFFDGVFADILLLIEAAILAGIDMVQGVVGALQKVTDQIAQLFASGGEFYIPIITPLWNKLGLPQLQIIDLITLIAAIPVTLVYRVISGHWLSQEADTLDLAAVGVTPPQWLTNALGIITAMITLFNGFINAISDTISAVIDPSLASLFPTPPWVTISGYANMALMMVGPIYTTVEQNGDGFYLMVIGLNVLSDLMSLFWGKVKNAAQTGQLLSWVLSMFTLIIQWMGDGSESQPWETIVSDIISNIPGCLSLLKYAESVNVKLIPPVADLGCAVAAAAFSLAGTIVGWDGTSDTRQYRRLIPVVIKS